MRLLQALFENTLMLFAVLLWCQARRFLEQLRKVGEVAVTDGHRHVGDSMVRIQKLELRLLDAQRCRVIGQREAGFLAEQTGEIGRIK